MTTPTGDACPNPSCHRIQGATRHCKSPTCTWRKCAGCGWLRDRQGHAMPGRHS